MIHLSAWQCCWRSCTSSAVARRGSHDKSDEGSIDSMIKYKGACMSRGPHLSRLLVNEGSWQGEQIADIQRCKDELTTYNKRIYFRPMQIVFFSRYSSIPYFECSLPSPECFQPPNGATSLVMATWFTPTMPYSSSLATRHVRFTFSV